MSIILILFDNEYININLLRGFKKSNIFLAKIISYAIILALMYFFFYLSNIILGFLFFSIPSAIYVHGKSESISIFSFFIYNLKYILLSFLTITFFSILSLIIYNMTKNKSISILLTIGLVVIQLFFGKYSVSYEQLQIKHTIITNSLFMQKVFFYTFIDILLIFMSYIIFKRLSF